MSVQSFSCLLFVVCVQQAVELMTQK